MADEIPKFERSVEAKPIAPNLGIGASYREFSSQTNLMGTIGAKVAQTASQHIATQLGYEAGKKPHGTLFPPITEFDKTFVNTYNTQAQATLSLQADELINKANLEMSKATRITPDLIQRTNAQLKTGLDNIALNAPTAIKGHLEYNFANQLLHSNYQYQNKMISQQREDQKNNLVAAIQESQKKAFELARDGNFAGADSRVKQIENLANGGVGSNSFTKKQALDFIDSAKKSAASAKIINEYNNAKAEGKGEQFLANFAKNKPSDLSYELYDYSTSALLSHVNAMHSLEAQDQNLQMANFQLRMQDVIQGKSDGITTAEIQQLKESLSPINFAKTMLHYDKAMSAHAANNDSIAQATANFSDADKFRISSDKALFASLQQQAQKMSDEKGIPMAEAQMRIAATAAGPIPKYLQILDTKAQSGNPQQMNEAIAARDYIIASNHPQNVRGLNEVSQAMLNNYQALKGNHDEATAAQIARESFLPGNTEKQKALSASFAAYVASKKKSGETDASFAVKIASQNSDLSQNDVVNVPELSQYIRDKMENYYKLNNGNIDLMKQQLGQDINSTFGKDTTNGRKEFTLFPIKQFFNLPENSNGFIHQDIIEQVGPQLKETKDLYDKGQYDTYYELKPRVSFSELGEALEKVQQKFEPKPGEFKDAREIAKARAEHAHDIKVYQNRIDEFKQGKPPIVVQHWRDGHTQEFQLEVRASPNMARNPNGHLNGYYDIRLQTKSGLQSFILANPNQSLIKYKPNQQRIIQNYLKVYPIIEEEFKKEKIQSQLAMLGKV